jgi:hypothetical protein
VLSAGCFEDAVVVELSDPPERAAGLAHPIRSSAGRNQREGRTIIVGNDRLGKEVAELLVLDVGAFPRDEHGEEEETLSFGVRERILGFSFRH